jgi:hypothetical protein
MDDDDGFEENDAASEADRAWREQTQETNDLAARLAPPHDDADDGPAAA